MDERHAPPAEQRRGGSARPFGGARGWLVALLALLLVAVGAAALALARPGVAWPAPAARSGQVARATATATLHVGGPCGSAATAVEPSRDETGQFAIHAVYADVLRYVQDAQAHPNGDRAALWERDVLLPNSQVHAFFGGETGDWNGEWRRALADVDPAAFACVARDMQAAHADVTALRALQADAHLLPGPPVAVYLVPWHSDAFTGAALPGAIFLPYWEPDALDRGRVRDPNAAWPGVATTLAHEYLHIVRFAQGRTADDTLLTAMVEEGLADSFANNRTGYDRGATCRAVLSPQREATLWAGTIRPLLAATPNAHILVGDAANGIPAGAGYCVGYHIVQGYLRAHPGVTWVALAALDAQAIYAGSGYDG